MPLRFVKTWNDIAGIAIAKNIRFMDHIDKTLLERMSYGGMIAEDRSKERLDRLVKQGLAHVVERESLLPIYYLTVRGNRERERSSGSP